MSPTPALTQWGTCECVLFPDQACNDPAICANLELLNNLPPAQTTPDQHAAKARFRRLRNVRAGSVASSCVAFFNAEPIPKLLTALAPFYQCMPAGRSGLRSRLFAAAPAPRRCASLTKPKKSSKVGNRNKSKPRAGDYALSPLCVLSNQGFYGVIEPRRYVGRYGQKMGVDLLCVRLVRY